MKRAAVAGRIDAARRRAAAAGVVRLHSLKLELYPKPGASEQWLLPVCSTLVRDRLCRLSPRNGPCWEDADIDGCPTVCFRMGRRQVAHINKSSFLSSYAKFVNALGEGVVHEFFYPQWLRNNNIRATMQNDWERRHGGIRGGRSNHGPSVRACARMSIT